MNKQKGFTLIEIIVVVFLVCMVAVFIPGYIMNIVALTGIGDWSTITPFEVLRLVGVVVPPLGGVLGWL